MTSIANRGRPAGEVRRVIFDALREQGAMPLRDIAERTKVGYQACMTAVKNAVRAEKLAIVGHEKRAHCKAWVALYDVVEPASVPEPQTGVANLQSALRSWR